LGKALFILILSTSCSVFTLEKTRSGKYTSYLDWTVLKSERSQWEFSQR